MVVVLSEQVRLLLVEKFESLLCVAQKHVLGVNDNFVARFGVFDSRVDWELAVLWVRERHEHFLDIVRVDHGLQHEGRGRETLVVKVQFEVCVKALVVQSIINFLLATLELVIAQENKLIVTGRN